MLPFYYKIRRGSGWSGPMIVPEDRIMPKDVIFTYCDEKGNRIGAEIKKKPKKIKKAVVEPISSPKAEATPDKAILHFPGREPVEIDPECLLHLLSRGLQFSTEQVASLKKENLDWDNKSGDVEIQFKKRHTIIKSLESFNVVGEAALSKIQD